jgi:hypothetical protein
MKKLVFSAIVMMAFSFASIANNNVVKNNSVKSIKTTKISIKKLVLVEACLDAWMGDYRVLRSAGLSPDDATKGANKLYHGCLDKKSIYQE